MAVVRQVHLVAGLALSLLLFVLALTGSALTYKEAYWRLVYPELRDAATDLGPRDHEVAFAAADATFGSSLRSVKLPEPGVPAYHLYLEGGEAFLAPQTLEVIDVWAPPDRVMSFLFDIHAHLTAGATGEQVVGVIGLLGVFMIVTGVVLWWPTWRRFRLRNLLPHGTTRGRLVSWHRDLGVLTSPLVALLLVTGSGLVFYGGAQALLNGLFGDPVPRETSPRVEGLAPGILADAATLARVHEALPDARLVFYYPPRAEGDPHGFRLKRPCELHPNGRSYAYVDGSRTVIDTVDACAMAPGERTVHAFYPLHAGKTGGPVYKLAVFLGGLALALVSASGTLAYLRKLGWIGARKLTEDPSGATS